MSKASKIVTITVSVLVVLALIILLILWLILTNMANRADMEVSHEYLQNVMSNDVVYLSDDFVNDNSLEWQPLELGRIDGIIKYSEEADVNITFNPNKDRNPDATQRIKSAMSYSYTLRSIDGSDGIPVKVQVSVDKGKYNSSAHKLNNEYGGYKYTVFESQSTGNNIYYLEATPKTFAKCTLSISVIIENKSEYTDEQIKAREEEIFKSAVDNIVKYQG